MLISTRWVLLVGSKGPCLYKWLFCLTRIENIFHMIINSRLTCKYIYSTFHLYTNASLCICIVLFFCQCNASIWWKWIMIQYRLGNKQAVDIFVKTVTHLYTSKKYRKLATYGSFTHFSFLCQVIIMARDIL